MSRLYSHIILQNFSRMHVISRTKLRDFCKKHADSCEPLDDWYKIASKADWGDLLEVQTAYNQTEAVGRFTVLISKATNTD